MSKASWVVKRESASSIKPCSHSAGGDRGVRRSGARLAGAVAAALGVAALVPSANAATVTWVGVNTGEQNWWQASNWSSNPNLPGALDDVVIDVAGSALTVKIDQNVNTINTLLSQEAFMMVNGTLSVGGTAVLNANFNFSGGTLTGAGKVTINSTATMINSAVMTGSGTMVVSATGLLDIQTGNWRKTFGRNLENFGTVNFGSTVVNGAIDLNNAGIYNRAGANFNINHSVDANIYGLAGTCLFLNEGTLSKSGTATVTFGGSGSQPVVFTNNGQVNVTAGGLVFQSGGTHTGDFSVSAGGALRFEQSHTFGASSDIVGAGNVTFNGGGSSVFQSAYNFAGTTAFTGSAGTFNSTFTTQTLTTSGTASLTFNSAATLNNATLNGTTTLGGPANITLTGAANWVSAGTMGSGGKFSIVSGASLGFSGGDHTVGRLLENSGTVNWSAGNLVLPAGGKITNSGTMTADLASNVSVSASGVSTVLINSGLLSKSSSGTLTFDSASGVGVRLENTSGGRVDVSAGTLFLKGGGSNAGQISLGLSGQLRLGADLTYLAGSTISGSGTVSFEGGSHSINAGGLTVTGPVLIGNSTVTFNAATTLSSIALVSGTLNGAGDLTVGSGLQWSGGVLDGSGKLIIGSTATMATVNSATPKTLQRVLENRGTFNWNGTGSAGSIVLNGGAVSNSAGATLNINGDQYSLSGTGTFANAGTVNKSGTGAASISGVAVSNSGLYAISAGTLNADTRLANSGTVTLSGGTLNLGGGISNTGLLNITSGVVNLSGTNTTAQIGSWQNSGGQLNILGNIDNTAAILNLTATTGSLRMLGGSQITGGLLVAGGGARLHVVGAATFSGLSTLGAETMRLDAAPTVVNDLSLGGNLTLESDVPLTVLFNGSQQIGGTGQIIPTGSVGATLTLAASAGSTLTLGAGVTAVPGDHDLTLGATGSTILIQGAAAGNLAGRTLTVAGTLSNQGVLEASNTGTLVVTGSVANLSGSTLSGGTWRVLDDSTLRIAGANITTNAATIILSGPNSRLYRDVSGTVSAVVNLAQNAAAGDLQILAGRTFTTVGDFANAGSITIGSGSTWTTPGVFNNSGQLSILAGGAWSATGTLTNSGTVIANASVSAAKLINNGFISQSTGPHAIAGDMIVGQGRSGARFDLLDGSMTVGGFGTVGSGTASATFNLSGGTLAVTKPFYVASGGANTSVLNITGGSLVTPELQIGFFSGAQGTVEQSSGTVTLAGSSASIAALTLGYSSLATTKGVYNLSGGTVSAAGASVGYSAGGSAINITGGTMNLTGSYGLAMATFAGGNGLVTLGGSGELNVAGNEQVGVAGDATITQSGGTHNLSGAMTLGPAIGSTGTYNLSGGSFTAPTINLLRGSFNQTGGTLAATNFYHTGGTVTGTLQNQGTYTYSNGVFAGRLLNSGTVVLNANLTTGNGLENQTSFTVVAGRTVVLNGAGLSNSGTVTVAGGSITATATTNSGTINQSAGSASLGNVSGTGSIQMTGGTLSAGSIRQDTLAVHGAAQVAIAAGAGTSVAKTLDIETGVGVTAAIDLTNNALVVDYDGSSPESTIRSLILTGKGAGAPYWTGPGIRSVTAGADVNLAIGYGEAWDVLGITGAQTATFAGQTVDATSVLVRVTLAGDANLDGTVNFDDLVRIAQNYETPGNWGSGDFNYDGFVNFDDLVSVAQHYEQSYPAAPAALAGDFAQAWAQVSVPEPSAVMLAALAAAGLMGRRRRR